jgi:hypothetical protein
MAGPALGPAIHAKAGRAPGQTLTRRELLDEPCTRSKCFSCDPGELFERLGHDYSVDRHSMYVELSKDLPKRGAFFTEEAATELCAAFKSGGLVAEFSMMAGSSS